jgi:hypothetical protein
LEIKRSAFLAEMAGVISDRKEIGKGTVRGQRGALVSK